MCLGTPVTVREPILSFHNVGPESWIQVLSLGDKSLSPLSGPAIIFKWSDEWDAFSSEKNV